MEAPTLKSLTNGGSDSHHSRLTFPDAWITFRRQWQWFLLSVVLFITAVLIFLRYKTPEYKITASLLVKDDTRGSDLGDPGVLEGLGLSAGRSNIDNEVEVLRSRTLAESVVKDLQLYVSYFATGQVKSSELFGQRPFTIHFIDATPDVLKENHTTYDFLLHPPNGWSLKNSDRHWQGKFGDTLNIPVGRAVIVRTGQPFVPGSKYFIRVSRTEVAVRQYLNALSVSATNKQVSVINFVLRDILPQRGELILNHHISNYLKSNVNDKNRIADSTIAFIDQNLNVVSSDLTALEKDIEKFRKNNRQADPEESGRILLQSSSQTDKAHNESEVRLKIIETLQDYLIKSPGRIIPASLMIGENSLNELVSRYNDLQLARNSAMLSNTSEHPYIKNLDEQLASLNENIKHGIEAQKASLKVHIDETVKQTHDFESQINLIPRRQRVYLDFNRQHQIKQDLFVFLLKKRIETALSKSATLASGRIIDSAKAAPVPYYPNKQLTLLLALLLGLGFPAAIIYIKRIFNIRVSSRSELSSLTSIPILAEISNRKPSVGGPDYVAEQFRVLRANIQHFTHQQEKVILLTSSMGGEGKSFVAINLAQSLAMMNMKVILVEFDLRKPQIAGYLGLRSEGITEYVHNDLKLTDCIQKSGNVQAFDVLTSGGIPAHPAELILTQKVREMIADLMEIYDYVLFDTAPAGIVADAQLLSRYAHFTLYIVRQQYTYKHQIPEIESLFIQDKFPKPHIVLNDVDPVPGYGYGYHTQKANQKAKKAISIPVN